MFIYIAADFKAAQVQQVKLKDESFRRRFLSLSLWFRSSLLQFCPFFQGDSNGRRSRDGPLLGRDPHQDLCSAAPASIFNNRIHPEASTPFYDPIPRCYTPPAAGVGSGFKVAWRVSPQGFV